MKSYDVIIAGGGIIGGAIAFELARQGASVLLLDRQTPGQEASWAAAGMLSPAPDAADAAALTPFARESYRLYPEFVAAIEDASGRKIALEKCGALELFFDAAGPRERDQRIGELARHSIAAEAMSISDARRREPLLNPNASAAGWIPDESCLDPRELTQATLAAAREAGAEIRSCVEAISILAAQNRCEGVLAAEAASLQSGTTAVRTGEKIPGENVVIAAGCFAGTIGGCARYAPTRPVRGQMLALRCAAGATKCILRSENGYIVPRADGRAIAGSTLENAGFEKCVTPAGLKKILDAAIELAPCLENAALLESWSGLRPGTPDHLPILGPTDVHGLFMATGHYRNGILLTPATAKSLAEWILKGSTSVAAVEHFTPLRFAAAARGARTQ